MSCFPIKLILVTFLAFPYFNHSVYTVDHKKSQLIFVCNFVKSQRIINAFSLLELKMNGTFDSMNHPPHLINVATLPCGSQNTENVILQWDMYHGFIKVDQGHHVP